jgi:hypothetical protein
MRLFHFHHWTAVSVQAATESFLFYRGPKAGEKVEMGEVTLVLQRCDCGAVRTIDLDGDWTLDEVQRR